ncbi:MAG: DUF2288 family protein [Enterobacterales bacterium]|nr:DUF2288 family protein [Enterobacterales bacterium]
MTQIISTKEQLNLETAEVFWPEIQVFFAQGKLLVVDAQLDLVEVATLIADNQVNQLKNLIENNNVSFVSAEWVKKHCTDTTLLWAVVVAPYVLTQLIEND